MLKAAGVDLYYGRIQALHGVSLDVAHGAITSIVGANGAGKTSFLRAVSGLTRPRAGSILFGDTNLIRREPGDIVRLGIAHVPAGGQLFKNLTVEQNLWLGAYVRTAARAQRAACVEDLTRLIELFPIIGKRARQAAGTLSGGEQQMVAIARALMGRPRLLLLDEPSLGLAPRVLEDIFDVLRRLNEREQLTILLVEQNSHLALDLATHVYVFENGRVVESGSPQELRAGGRLTESYLGITSMG